jgi:hypothetical protein
MYRCTVYCTHDDVFFACLFGLFSLVHQCTCNASERERSIRINSSPRFASLAKVVVTRRPKVTRMHVMQPPLIRGTACAISVALGDIAIAIVAALHAKLPVAFPLLLLLARAFNSPTPCRCGFAFMACGSPWTCIGRPLPAHAFMVASPEYSGFCLSRTGLLDAARKEDDDDRRTGIERPPCQLKPAGALHGSPGPKGVPQDAANSL